MFIHDTAVVDDGASIGVGTKIYHWSHVMPGAHIGNNCTLGQNVYVGSKASIGHGVKIQNNVSVYDNVILEDDVFCGPSVVFTNVYNPRAFIQRKEEYKTTFVRRGATLGANATLICGVEVGSYALVGAGSLVNRNIPSFGLFVGVPSRQIGWVTKEGLKLPFSIEQDDAEYKDGETTYLYKDGHVSIIS